MKERMPTRNYEVGDWFAVPLRDGGFAVGVVARANPNGVLLGYFFGPKFAEAPNVHDLSGLTADDALTIRRFGHLALVKEDWALLGRTEGWNRDEWPMPAFIRYEELTGRAFRVFYADDDPNNVIREEEVSPGANEQGPKDGLLGVGAAERLLTSLLG